MDHGTSSKNSLSKPPSNPIRRGHGQWTLPALLTGGVVILLVGWLIGQGLRESHPPEEHR
jgi:hypothetical protein